MNESAPARGKEYVNMLLTDLDFLWWRNSDLSTKVSLEFTSSPYTWGLSEVGGGEF